VQPLDEGMRVTAKMCKEGYWQGLNNIKITNYDSYDYVSD
jgi:hypothetical protein